MSDLFKTATNLRETQAMDLAAYRALAREHMATIYRLVLENQDLRMELHALQPEGGGAAHSAAGLGPLNDPQHTATGECPSAECVQCGARDCPHGEPLHYHHDGCPACEQGLPQDPQ